MTGDIDETLEISAGSTPSEEIAVGSIVCNKYEIEKVLGAGGMGTVYLVRQILLGKKYALKVVDSKKVSEVSLRRFQQEARMAASLKHPNLVEVHDFGVTDEHHPFLLMDFIEGESLSQLLKKRGTLSVERVVALAIQVAFGLLYAHENKVVHRDIKPGNIMLLHADEITTEGAVKIVDFGIAKMVQADEGEIQALTKTGEIFGSPLYMSPEQCKGSLIDQRADIYSLGCVMYECLTGFPPFWGESAMATMMKRLSEEPLSLKEGSLGKEFPPLMEKISKKCLQIEPENRYQTMADLIQDLSLLQRNETETIQIAGEKHSESIDRKRLIKKQSGLILTTIALTAICAVAIDRALLPQAEPDTQPKKAKQKVDETALNDSTNKQLEAQLGDTNLSRYPTVETWTDPKDKKWHVIRFPTALGKIRVFPSKKWIPADGKVLVPFGAEIDIFVNKQMSQDPKIFRDISNLKFRRIEYSGLFLVDDDSILPLKDLDYLKEIEMEGTRVQNLAPFYKNPRLEVLDVGATAISTAELLKVERLGDLRALGFGPIAEPKEIFDHLVKTNRIRRIIFRGNTQDKVAAAKQLTDSDVESLAKLNRLRALELSYCPALDDAKLSKLLPLQELEELTLKDCAITPKSIPTFKKFKHLKHLILTTEGWSEKDKYEISHCNFRAYLQHSRAKERLEKKIEMENAVDLIN